MHNGNPKGFGSSASPKGKAPVRGYNSRQVPLLIQNMSRLFVDDVFRSVPATVKTGRLEGKNTTLL